MGRLLERTEPLHQIVAVIGKQRLSDWKRKAVTTDGFPNFIQQQGGYALRPFP
ncbi:hypothetical protein RGR602_CH00148 [Rhizobium gallicum bv. gallicum R602sp]|uniref:Uncharacterized protein n=1 Tax=Rhizobium gallicum bv. gallicum R602sp TaxID=1041138 RepID=A0A0B4WZ39_9HYPH|nr:hypothetical protein RGR602_CH00148 [Rhizobium gallicum bv. gallicum R602sp]